MSEIERMTITLPAEMAAMLKHAVQAGDYASSSEVVRDALRDWQDKRAIRAEKLAALKHDIDIGLKDIEAGRVVDRPGLERLAHEAAALFTEDGTWDGGPGLGRVTGRRDIAARLSAPTLDFSRHLFLKPDIRIDGDRASARWDLLSPCRRPDGTSYWMCGYEDDDYQRVDGAWLHRSMRLTTVFMAPVGAGWTRILA